MGYETEAWREPKIADSDTLITSEHGRVIFHVDYRSHWFVLAKSQFGGYVLLVKHGGGEERIPMPLCNFRETVNVIASLSSDLRYLLLHHLYDIHSNARREARDATAKQYRDAFAQGALKKRKMRGSDACKVWIERYAQRAG